MADEKRREVVVFQKTQEEKKQHSDTQNKAAKKLDTLIQQIQQPLLNIKTNFPLDPWPNYLTVNPMNIIITVNIFFWTSYTQTIPIEEVASVFAEKGPIWSTVRIVRIRQPNNPTLFRPVWPKDADKARNIIQGLLVSKKQAVDVSQIPEKEKVEKLGQAQQAE